MSYSNQFIDGYTIDIPSLKGEEINYLEQNGISIKDYYLDYINFSTLQNPIRKLPYYSAANIDGNLFKSITRKELFNGKGDRWKKDKRIPGEAQLGSELYSAAKSDFDRGHLTKREDAQWGDSTGYAKSGAESTFFFTNAAPQVDRLNRGVWRRIEDYILHHEVIKNKSKITLFTGPVFQENDPNFVTKVRNKTIQLPVYFWKVIYYLNGDDLFYTAFLTSQKTLLEKRRIVKPIFRSDEEQDRSFMMFKDAETYQVPVSLIEKLSKLKFSSAHENYKKETPEKLVLSGVEVRSDEAMIPGEAQMNLIL
ncbi:MAG: DNA/RNA non-specific endonuclease [Flavobacteriaceae bacterium]|nr:DNA/RNA non-specific endonuclease [Flavobacteriaceae bacterium]